VFVALVCCMHTTAQVCPPADVPDPLFQDTNGDGIDGDTSRAIFVATTGSDANPGTMSQPVLTIQYAISLAAAALPMRDVYVAGGSYLSASPIALASGVSIYGLFDGPPFWGRSGGNTTTIGGANPALSAVGVNYETHVEGFVLQSIDAVGGSNSSYGVIVN
jgi:hypothetical protein